MDEHCRNTDTKEIQLPQKAFRLLLLSCIIAVSGCATDREDPVAPTEAEESAPASEAWDVTFVVREGALRRMEISAAYMARYESDDSTVVVLTSDGRPEPVMVNVYDREGAEAALLTAHRIHYDERERVMVARGDVVVTGVDDTRLETEMLVWNETDREIRSSSYVRIATGDDAWQGYGLRADEDLKNFELTQARARLTVPDK